MTKYLTIGQTAERLGLQVDTLRKLESSGEITAARTNGGHRRFAEAEVDRFLKHRGKSGGAKSSSRRPSRRVSNRAAPNRDPSTGEFTRASANPDEGWEDIDDELSAEELDEEEMISYRPPPSPPVRYAPVPHTPTPPPEQFPVLGAIKAFNPIFDPAETERLRLKNIRTIGQGAIPWDAPADFHRQVIVDLERFVTSSQFPAELPLHKAKEMVTGRVEGVLRPWREAVEKAKRAKEAKEAIERQRSALIAKGNGYAHRETADWDFVPKLDAWAEVKKVLLRDVEPDMTDLEVEDLVDEVLDRWDDDENENGEED
jgi:excisionase family DNA binding protein